MATRTVIDTNMLKAAHEAIAKAIEADNLDHCLNALNHALRLIRAVADGMRRKQT